MSGDILLFAGGGGCFAGVIFMLIWLSSYRRERRRAELAADARPHERRTRRGQLQDDIKFWERQDDALGHEMVEILAEQLAELGGLPPLPEPAPMEEMKQIHTSTFMPESRSAGTPYEGLVKQHASYYRQLCRMEDTWPPPAARSIAQQGVFDSLSTRLSALDQELRKHEVTLDD